jgi:hypothetical protein
MKRHDVANNLRKGILSWGKEKNVKQDKAPQKAAKEETTRSPPDKSPPSKTEKTSPRNDKCNDRTMDFLQKKITHTLGCRQ